MKMEYALIEARRNIAEEGHERGESEGEIVKKIRACKYEPLITEIRNAERAIEKYAQFYHAKESECPDSFRFLMLMNGWRNPFNALHELTKRIYTNERLMTKEQKKGYKSRYREMEALVQKYANDTMRELRG